MVDKLAQLRRHWLPYITLASTLSLTVLSSYYVHRTAQIKDQLRFANEIQRTENEIQRRLFTYTALLRAGAGLFAGSRTITPQEFENFVGQLRLRENYPGIQGIGYSLRIPSAAVPTVVANMQRQGIPNFQVRPTHPRSEYHAIIYLEPLDRRNEAAIGYDMFTETIRRRAMEQARDGAEPAASGRVTLVQEIDPQKQAGFLIYLPVYRQGRVPMTLAERRSQLQGFVYSPFRADDLLDGIFGYKTTRLIDLKVYDGTDLRPENLLHQSRYNTPTPHVPKFTATQQVDVAGRTWSLVITSRPELERASESRYALYILLGGVVLSLVLFGLTWAQVRARNIMEQTASDLRQSEIRFRTLVEQSPLSIQILAPDGRTLQVNRAWEELWGTAGDRPPADNILIEPWLTANNMNAYLQQAFAGQAVALPPIAYQLPQAHPATAVENATSNPASPTSQRWIQAYIYPVKDEVGQVREVVLLQEDITERELAEQALKQSNERLKLLYSISSGLLLYDQTPDFMSSLFHQLSQHLRMEVYCHYLFDQEQQMLRLSLANGIPAATLEEIRWLPLGSAVCGTVAETRTPWVLEDLLQLADPKLELMRSLQITAYASYPLVARGQLIGTLSFGSRSRSGFEEDELALLQVVCDQVATSLERTHLVAELQRQTEELAQANQMKDDFLAVLSHELRTPLNAMMGWTQMLLTRNFDQEMTNRALGIIDRNTHSLMRLIEDLLDVSRIITGKLKLHLTEVRWAAIIETTIESIQPSAVEKNITVHCHLDTSLIVEGDTNRLHQIGWNLLSNAVKFTPEQGEITVELAAITQSVPPDPGSRSTINRLPRTTANHSYKPKHLIPAKYAQLTIRDTGQGIDSDFLPHVFDRFRQADSSTTRHYGGLGLGLAIVHHLVELHGGTIVATSQGEGKGATFTVKLPLLATTPVTIPSPVTHKQQVVQTNDTALLHDLHILIVDDEPDTLELISTTLTQAGAAVTAVNSAAAAMAELRHHPPDILISDIGMPDTDGYELIKQVRTQTDAPTRELPAIALTAYAGESNRQQALAAGYQQHLTKPIEPSKLVAAIAHLAQRR